MDVWGPLFLGGGGVGNGDREITVDSAHPRKKRN